MTFNWLWLFRTVVLEIASPCFAIAFSVSYLISPFLLPFRKTVGASRSETVAAPDNFLQTYGHSTQKGLRCVRLEETTASRSGCLGQLMMWKS